MCAGLRGPDEATGWRLGSARAAGLCRVSAGHPCIPEPWPLPRTPPPNPTLPTPRLPAAAEFADIQEAAASARQVGELQAWRNLLKRQYRPQAVLAVAIPTFQQWTGINRCVRLPVWGPGQGSRLGCLSHACAARVVLEDQGQDMPGGPGSPALLCLPTPSQPSPQPCRALPCPAHPIQANPLPGPWLALPCPPHPNPTISPALPYPAHPIQTLSSALPCPARPIPTLSLVPALCFPAVQHHVLRPHPLQLAGRRQERVAAERRDHRCARGAPHPPSTTAALAVPPLQRRSC